MLTTPYLATSPPRVWFITSWLLYPYYLWLSYRFFLLLNLLSHHLPPLPNIFTTVEFVFSRKILEVYFVIFSYLASRFIMSFLFQGLQSDLDLKILLTASATLVCWSWLNCSFPRISCGCLFDYRAVVYDKLVERGFWTFIVSDFFPPFASLVFPD